MYSGNLHSKSVENHVFIIHSPKSVVDRGVGSFSLKGFEEFIAKDFAKQLPGVNSSATNPVDYVNAGHTGTYKVFVDGTGYEERTVALGNLIAWIKLYENSQTSENIDTQHASSDNGNLLQEIIESVDSEVNFGNKVTCHIYDIGTRRNDRTMSNRGAPLITDTPRRKTGARYSYGATKKIQKKNAKPQLGTYVDVVSNNMKDVKGTVTAPLKISYNEALGCYDSSNQLLARLITDLDPAAIQAVNLSMDDLTGRYMDDLDFYTPSSAKYMGQFSTGMAVPLSVKDGNPNAFGPNFIKVEGDHLRMEAIRVVNRSDNAYDTGQVVLCNMIDGEWIVQTFGGKMEAVPDVASFGGWGFSMFAASSQQYFIDLSDNDLVTPATVLAKLKARFFHTAKNISGVKASICNDNGARSVTLQLSKYAQFTSDDLSNNSTSGMGGAHLHRCNVEINKDGDSDQGFPNDSLGLWWGASFPDGYSGGTGDMQVPADIGTLGDYPGSEQTDSFPREDGNKIVNAVNSNSNMAQLVNNIIMGRIYRNGQGAAFWAKKTGSTGLIVGQSKQYPVASAGTTAGPTSTGGPTTTGGPTSTAGPTTTAGPSTTGEPATTAEPPVENDPTGGTTASPDITTSTTTVSPSTSAGPTTTPTPVMDFPTYVGDTSFPSTTPTTTDTPTTTLPPLTTPQPLSSTPSPSARKGHKAFGYNTTADPNGNVTKTNTPNNMDE